MRYLVAADGDTLDAPVARRFGHAAAHLLVDAEDGSIVVTTGDVEKMQAYGLGRGRGCGEGPGCGHGGGRHHHHDGCHHHEGREPEQEG